MKLNSVSIYFLTNLMLAGLPLVTLPFFTHYMTPADYGVWGIFNLLAMYIGVVSRWELNNSLKANFAGRDKLEFKAYINSAFYFGVMVLVFFVILWLIVLPWNMGWNGVGAAWILGLICISFMKVQAINLHNLFQISNRAVLYSFWSICANVALYGISILLMYCFGMGWEGRAWAEFIVASVSFVFVIYYLRDDFGLGFELDFSVLLKMLQFSTPILGAAVISFYILTFDRLMLAKEFNPEVLGLYMVALQISSSLGLIFNSIAPAWEASVYNFAAPSLHSHIKVHLKKFIFIALLVVVALLILPSFLGWILTLLTNKDYQGSEIFILPTLLLVATNGLFSLMQPLMIFLNKNKDFLKIKMAMLIMVTILMPYSIELFGAKGPALGLAFCYVAGIFSLFFLMRNLININH